MGRIALAVFWWAVEMSGPTAAAGELTYGGGIGQAWTGMSVDSTGKSWKLSVRFRLDSAPTGVYDIVDAPKYLQMYAGQVHYCDGCGGNYPKAMNYGTTWALDGQFHTMVLEVNREAGTKSFLIDGVERDSGAMSTSDLDAISHSGNIRLPWYYNVEAVVSYVYLQIDGVDVAKYDFYKGSDAYCTLGDCSGDSPSTWPLQGTPEDAPEAPETGYTWITGGVNCDTTCNAHGLICFLDPLASLTRETCFTHFVEAYNTYSSETWADMHARMCSNFGCSYGNNDEGLAADGWGDSEPISTTCYTHYDTLWFLANAQSKGPGVLSCSANYPGGSAFLCACKAPVTTTMTTTTQAPIGASVQFCRNVQGPSGLYTFVHKNSVVYEELCDMTTDGGGWMLFATMTSSANDFINADDPAGCARDDGADSCNVLTTNKGSPSTVVAFSRNWENLIDQSDLPIGSEVLIKRGETGEWVKITTKEGWVWDDMCATGHGHVYSKGDVTDQTGHLIGQDWYFNGCNCGGGCGDQNDGIGFGPYREWLNSGYGGTWAQCWRKLCWNGGQDEGTVAYTYWLRPKQASPTSTSTTSTTTTSTVSTTRSSTTTITATSTSSTTTSRSTTTSTTATATETSSTTTTSTATETATTTSTTVTTYLGVPNCTATHMRCPVPTHSSGSYVLLGGENDTACSMQTSSGGAFFEFPIGACNSTRSINETSGLVTDIATMAYLSADYGQIVFNHSPATPPSVIICTCQSPVTTLAASGQIKTPPESGGQGEVVGSGNFEAILGVYSNDAYEAPLSDGEVFPVSARRMYMQVASSSTADLIGLDQCIVSPSDDMDSPYAVRFLDVNCPRGPLDLRTHPDDESHVVRVSVLSFKFAGSADVFAWCTAVRCAAEPCGQCSGLRRLKVDRRFARQLQDQSALSQVHFRAQPFQGVLVLPGPIDVSGDAPQVWLRTGALPSADVSVRSNVTLYTYHADLPHDFLDALADALAAGLSDLFLREVQVLRILAWQAAPHERLLSEDGPGAANSTNTEALIAESAVMVNRKEEVPVVLAKLASLIGNENVAASFAQGLLTNVNNQSLSSFTALRVVFGPAFIEEKAKASDIVRRPVATSMPPEEVESEATNDNDSSIRFGLVTAVVGVTIGCICIITAAIWWQMRCRRGAAPASGTNGLGNDAASGVSVDWPLQNKAFGDALEQTKDKREDRISI